MWTSMGVKKLQGDPVINQKGTPPHNFVRFTSRSSRRFLPYISEKNLLMLLREGKETILKYSRAHFLQRPAVRGN